MINSLEISADRTKALDSLLTRDEFLGMMKETGDAKDKAILALGVLVLRASEIAACDASWVDFANRTLPIPPRAAMQWHARLRAIEPQPDLTACHTAERKTLELRLRDIEMELNFEGRGAGTLTLKSLRRLEEDVKAAEVQLRQLDAP